MRILILNGPNLNLLGKREPEIYGGESFEDYFKKLRIFFPHDQLEYYQTNHEGGLIDKLHEVGFSYNGIVLNAGGYTHTSIAILDAIKAITTPVVEVHITNLLEREPFRHNSMIADGCIETIAGHGMESYRLGVEALKKAEHP